MGFPAPQPASMSDQTKTTSSSGSSAAPGHTPVHVDWSAIEARFKGGAPFVTRLATTMLDSHTPNPARLRAASAAGDLEAIAFVAHGIKGLTGNLLLEEAHRHARETEDAARAGDPSAVSRGEALADTLEGVLAALRSRVG